MMNFFVAKLIFYSFNEAANTSKAIDLACWQLRQGLAVVSISKSIPIKVNIGGKCNLRILAWLANLPTASTSL